MDNNQIVQAVGPCGALTQCHDWPFNRFRLVDEDISIREPRDEVMPATGSLVESSADGEEVLRVVGVVELTSANGNLFLKQVRAALNRHTIIEIDLSRTISMDCAGLGTLIAIRNLLRDRNGAVRLTNPTSSVQQLLDLMRAGTIFEIVSGIGVFCQVKIDSTGRSFGRRRSHRSCKATSRAAGLRRARWQ